MRLFDIFDQWGNKIGEAHEPGNPLDGAGCFLTAFITFVLAAFTILGWPAFFKELFSNNGKSNAEVIGQLLYLFLHFGVLAYRVARDCKKKSFSFRDSWGDSVICVTLVAGGGYWVIASLVDGFTFKYLLASLFLTFALSVSSAFFATLLTALLRNAQKSK